jgi:uncharacterized protein YbcV (DUF1398 family)
MCSIELSVERVTGREFSVEPKSMSMTLDLIYADQLTFEDMITCAFASGIERITCDLVRKEHVWYEKDYTVGSHPLPIGMRTKISSFFNEERLCTAITSVDIGELSAFDFTEELMATGVALVHFFLNSQKNIYISLQGRIYTETW